MIPSRRNDRKIRHDFASDLERVAEPYASECDRVRHDLAIAESQLRDYQARLGQAFPHEAYLSQPTGLRDQLKLGLSASAAAPPDDKRPLVAGFEAPNDSRPTKRLICEIFEKTTKRPDPYSRNLRFQSWQWIAQAYADSDREPSWIKSSYSRSHLKHGGLRFRCFGSDQIIS